MKPIAVGADDAAFELKAKIVDYLKSKGIPVEDYGVNNPDPAILYPDVALSVAQAVAAGKHDRGILMCGTGIGVAITANKVPGIRAAVCHDSYSAERSRKITLDFLLGRGRIAGHRSESSHESAGAQGAVRIEDFFQLPHLVKIPAIESPDLQ